MTGVYILEDGKLIRSILYALNIVCFMQERFLVSVELRQGSPWKFPDGPGAREKSLWDSKSLDSMLASA